MGAYAAISSLMNTLQQLRQPNQRLICGSEELVESTYQNLCALQDFLEDATKEATDLETLKVTEEKIRLVVYKVEDAVDSSLRSIILAESSRKNQQSASRSFLSFCSKNQSAPSCFEEVCEDDREMACRSFNQELQGVEKEVDSLREEVMQIEFNKNGRKYREAATPPSSSSGRSAMDDLQNAVVGMKDDFNTILDRLTAQTDELIVIPIVGMGGIGKTTLARKAFLDSSIIHRFDTHAWVTISETYNERLVLLDLVSSITGDRIQSYEQTSNDRLAEIVYRGLKRRRFLIVIDDLWSTDPWDQMQRTFPDDNNKSRILLTTRLNSVANYVSSPYFPPHDMSFLSLDDAWNLFSERVFRSDPCPRELEEIGKHIIQQCRGLPLAIIVIAGLLDKMERTHNNWKKIEKNLNSFFATEVTERCEAILSFSYTHLPQHLKACFLYVGGGFREDMDISVSKLIELWIAEQFIKARSNITLEVVAEEYLQELVDRSLILVGTRRPNGRIKTCKIHDVIRQLCIKIAQSGNVVHSVNQNMYPVFSKGRNNNERRVMIQDTSDWTSLGNDFMSKTRTLVFTSLLFRPSLEYYHHRPFQEHHFSLHLKLLKVLDVLSVFNDFSGIIPGLVHLRYVAANILYAPSLAKLWNIQTIIFVGLEYFTRLELPPDIWTMSELRHLKVSHVIHMPNPLEADRIIGQGPLFLKNMQRLHISLDDSTLLVEILRRTPNLTKLKIWFNTVSIEWPAFFECLRHLQGLETLHMRQHLRPSYFSNWNTFLPNLKQLKLSYFSLAWENMVVLAKLPNLEVLKTYIAFEGKAWRLAEDVVFQRLKYLRIANEHLTRWEATSDNFPMLEQLVLTKLRYLEEIPQSIGEIMTLKLIQIHYCSSGAVRSANEIQEEQKSWGNYELQLQISEWRETFEGV